MSLALQFFRELLAKFRHLRRDHHRAIALPRVAADADLLVGRIRSLAAGVARHHAPYTTHLLEDGLQAPEAAAAQGGELKSSIFACFIVHRSSPFCPLHLSRAPFAP